MLNLGFPLASDKPPAISTIALNEAMESLSTSKDGASSPSVGSSPWDPITPLVGLEGVLIVVVVVITVVVMSLLVEVVVEVVVKTVASFPESSTEAARRNKRREENTWLRKAKDCTTHAKKTKSVLIVAYKIVMISKK